MAIYNSKEELLNTNWQEKINDAKASGNSVLAAQYEQARNDKIASKEYQDWGGKQEQTNNYATYLPTNSSAYDAAYNAAQKGDWDAVGRAVNQIAIDEGLDKYSTYNMANANSYFNELTKQFGYNAKDYYNQLYDNVYGANSSATYDATGGAIKTYADLVKMVGQEDQAQKLLNQYTNSNALTNLSNDVGRATNFKNNDMAQYLENLYAKNLEAELAALKSAYDSNVAELESQNNKIADQYQLARNQTAAQNALATQSMNERALATGLSTGTSGQLALAQNMAYQNNLGNLWAKEAQDKAESDRMLAQLLRDYNASVNQTAATINANKAEALYNEMIRQQEVAAENAKMSRDYALTLLSKGIMPDSNTLEESGISTNEAAALKQIMSSNTSKANNNKNYYNGSLSTKEVENLQRDINKYLPENEKIAVDGLWGEATKRAAGNLTADQYANIYYKQNSWSGRSDR